MLILTIIICLILLDPVVSFGDTYIVPTEYTVIQDAIDASTDGDTVLVLDGIFSGTGNKNLDFGGRAITVKSENGPESCIIDVLGSGHGFVFDDGEPPTAVLEGFTIRYGNWLTGAGIHIEDSHPTIRYCIILENQSLYSSGGGIYIMRGNPLIDHCTIVGNRAQYGAGIYLEESSPVITNCVVADNELMGIVSCGSGFFCASGDPRITYNDVCNPDDDFYGTAVPPGIGYPTQVNYNGDPCDDGFNIFLDPLFEGMSCRLTGESPAVDAGDPQSPYDPDNTITDQGALYRVHQVCIVELTPLIFPISIPPQGGAFDFDIAIENAVDSAIVVTVWTEIVLPSGEIYGPVLMRSGIALPAGANITRSMSQSIPGNAPAGYYLYRAIAGISPEFPCTADSFIFGKQGAVDAQGILDDWNLTGWDDRASHLLEAQPSEVVLCSCSPNPFNPSTTISFNLPIAAQVQLRVYDLHGRRITSHQPLATSRQYNPGHHSINFNGTDLPSGIYIYRLTAGEHSGVGKMVLLK